MNGKDDYTEAAIDLAATGWRPGDCCPACGNSTVYAIVRAGMRFDVNGSWTLDETLSIYDAFCPMCDWLPPVGSL